MHEANDLAPPLMHPWPFSQFPENDCRGDISLGAAKLPEEGYLVTILVTGKICAFSQRFPYALSALALTYRTHGSTSST